MNSLLASGSMATETADPLPPPEDDVPNTVPPIAQRLPNFETRLMATRQGTFKILHREAEPGETLQLRWRSPQLFGGFAMLSPLTVIHGQFPGPVMCFTGAIHGDELNGIEIVRRVAAGINAAELRGTIVAMPIVNVEGFHRRDRYIGSRADLNRMFPGTENGSYASRVAHALFQDIILNCDALIDVHTGSFYRENLPQVRGEMENDAIASLATSFGGMTVLNSPTPSGSLRGAATDAGIPAVVLEIGVALILDMEQVVTTVQGIRAMLGHTGVLPSDGKAPKDSPHFFAAHGCVAMQMAF